MTSILYFSDNFFSAGITDILDESGEKVGELDLKSAFSSSVAVHIGGGVIKGKFKFFSNRWFIFDEMDQEIGSLKQSFTFLGKRFQYKAYQKGEFVIDSKAFSKEYEIYDENQQVVAKFEKTSSIFESASFKLTNNTDLLLDEELIAVIMGVNMIHKHHAANSSITS